jgi:hypothetical protein
MTRPARVRGRFIAAAAMFGVAPGVTPIEVMPVVSDDIARGAALG